MRREERLEELRRQAAAGELTPEPQTSELEPSAASYHGRPILKPPVWTWEIPLYFFVGGLAGMSAVIALAAFVTGASILLTRNALLLAVAGALVSAPLLILDLGRPRRFLNMLRVFKWRSPMSVGVWTLVLFSTAVAVALFLLLGFHAAVEALGAGPARLLLILALAAAALTGLVLATYTGVLLGATANPLWSRHRALLPVHFGTAGMGSAAAALILAGVRIRPLVLLLGVAALVEIVLWIWLGQSRMRTGTEGRVGGRPQYLLLGASLLMGIAPLVLLPLGLTPWAAALFLLGALLSRYGWVAAGRAAIRTR